MTTLGRRRALSAALGCAVLAERLTDGAPARADLFGGDIPILVGILTQTIQQAITMSNVLIQSINQVKMMTTMLETLNVKSFADIVNFINTARYSYSSLTYNVKSMTYRLQQLDAEYQKLFGSGAPPKGTTVAQHTAQMQAWNQEVLSASQVAARQQTTLSQLDDHATHTQTLIQQSQAASGVVSQLQLVVQMLGITSAQLNMLNQTLATTSRVLTDMAAAGASERLLSSAKRDDARDGYTDKGAPVAVPHTLP